MYKNVWTVILEFMYNVSQDCWLSGDVIGDWPGQGWEGEESYTPIQQ